MANNSIEKINEQGFAAMRVGSRNYLDNKREDFCRLVAKGTPIDEAYQRIIDPRCSLETAKVMAENLCRVEEVAERLLRLYKQNAVVRDITKEEVIYEMHETAQVSPADYFDQNMKLKPIAIWTPEMRAACESIKPTRHGFEIQVYGKKHYWDRVSDMMGFNAPTKIEEKHVDEFASKTDEELREIMDMDFEDVTDNDDSDIE